MGASTHLHMPVASSDRSSLWLTMVKNQELCSQPVVFQPCRPDVIDIGCSRTDSAGLNGLPSSEHRIRVWSLLKTRSKAMATNPSQKSRKVLLNPNPRRKNYPSMHPPGKASARILMNVRDVSGYVIKSIL